MASSHHAGPSVDDGYSRREDLRRRTVSAVAELLFGGDRHDAWIRGGWWPRYLAVGGMLAAIILCRRPDVVSRPQFWAEDGPIFFCDAFTLGFTGAIFHLYRGFPYLGARLIAAFGSLFPIAAAPRVYTMAAIVIEALSVATFSLPRFRHLVTSDALRVAFCVACVCLPADVEVFATPTNVGWFLSIFLLFVSLSTAPRRTTSLVGLTTCSVVAVASTPLGVLFVPLWLLRVVDGALRRDRCEVVLGAILVATVGLLFLLIPALGAADSLTQNLPEQKLPPMPFRWANLAFATAYTVVGFVVQHGTLEQLATSDRYAFHFAAMLVLGLVIGIAALEGRKRLVTTLCCLSLMIGSLGMVLVARPTFNLFLESPRWALMLSNKRYAVFPVACATLCLVVVLDGIVERWRRRLAAVAACAIVSLAWWPAFSIAPLPDREWSQWAVRLQAKLAAQSPEPLVIPTPPACVIKIDAEPMPNVRGSPSGSEVLVRDRCAGSTFR